MTSTLRVLVVSICFVLVAAVVLVAPFFRPVREIDTPQADNSPNEIPAGVVVYYDERPGPRNSQDQRTDQADLDIEQIDSPTSDVMAPEALLTDETGPKSEQGENQTASPGKSSRLAKLEACRYRGVSPEFLAQYDVPIDPVNNSRLPIPLPLTTSFGYQPDRNLPRWHIILSEVLKDGPIDRPLAMIDYGSNAGFFSLAWAVTFPRSLVLSVDMMSCHMFDAMGNQGGMQAMAPRLHRSKIKFYNATNNILCDARLTSFTFGELQRVNVLVDYQLSLSVLHWLHLKGQQNFMSAFANHVLNARTTFVEMPLPAEGFRTMDVRQWYRNIPNNDPMILMRKALARRVPDRNVSIRNLTPHSYRPLFRVDLLDRSPSDVRYPCNDMLRFHFCRHATCTPYEAALRKMGMTQSA